MRLKKFGIASCVFLLAVTLAGSCASNDHPGTTAPFEPLEIISITGPLLPGPSLQLVLKNISNKRIISIYATFTLDANYPSPPPGVHIDLKFNFDFTTANPLPPGGVAIASQDLVYAMFVSSQAYPLHLYVGYINDAGQALTTDYTKQVKVVAPPS